MIISDLYKTEISVHYTDANNGLGVECYEYDLSSFVTSSNQTSIKIAVRLKDFNNANVTGKTVTLKCSDGYFTSNNGTSISGTATNSISLNIINGLGIAEWTTTTVGLVTFSANETKTNIFIRGSKTENIPLGISGVSLYVNKSARTAFFKIIMSGIKMATADKFYYLKTNGTFYCDTNNNLTISSAYQIIPEEYRPVLTTSLTIYSFSSLVGSIGETGFIRVRPQDTHTSGISVVATGVWLY